MKKAVIYARVSSKEQEQGFSIDAQLNLTRKYARTHQFTIVKEFAQSESAKAAGRKQFGAMLQFLRENPDCRVIIVEKTDRLSRNLHDFVAVEDFVEELNAEVHLIKEGQIIKSQGKSQDRLVQGIFALLARNYVLNMQEEIQKGQLVKAEKGQYPGRAPFGYAHDRATRTIVADLKRGPVVTLMFNLYGTGGYTIPSLRKVIRETSGETISRSYCHKILKSRFYVGMFSWRGLEYKGTHPALIDGTTFERVQKVISGRNVNKSRRIDGRFPYRGLGLKCTSCGCAITAERHKGHDYYRCSFGHGWHEFKYMRGEYLSKLLGDVLQGIRLPEDVVQRIGDWVEADYATVDEKRGEQISKLNQRLSALRTRMKKAYRDKFETNIDEKFWAENWNEWVEEERTVEAALESLQQSRKGDPAFSLQKVLELAQNAHSLYLTGTDTERAELLREVLSNCHTDGVSLSPIYKKPFEIIFQRGQNEEWRRGRDSNPRYPFGYAGFQDRSHQPLGHLSGNRSEAMRTRCEYLIASLQQACPSSGRRQRGKCFRMKFHYLGEVRQKI